MTLTPCSSAFFSIAAALPESSWSRRRTLAPSEMSASAWLCCVLALPCALSILKSLLFRPAVSNAFLSYGASKET